MKVGSIELDQRHFTGASFVTSAGSALIKLALGVFTQSLLVMLNGIYMLVLVAPRSAAFFCQLFGSMTPERTPTRERAFVRVARNEHLIQIIIAVSLIALGVSFIVLSNNIEGTRLGLSTIPAISFATCAFAKLGVAIWGLVKLRGSQNSVVLANKLTGLADGMASIVLTQIALRELAGTAGDVFDTTLGVAVGIAIIALGAWYLRRLRQSRPSDDQQAPTGPKPEPEQPASRPHHA